MKKRIQIVMVGAMLALGATPGSALTVELAVARHQEDPGDSLYRAGRTALNERDYRDAARIFGQLTGRFPESGYAPDAYYYQAFALYRTEDLPEALALLEHLAEAYPDASNLAEAERLTVRIEGAMARRGDGPMTALRTSGPKR